MAKERENSLQRRVQEFRDKNGRAPGLAVLLVGDDPASHIYVKNKVAACERVGISSIHIVRPSTLSQIELEGEIRTLNDRDDVDGILVQMPLPRHLSANAVLDLIAPEKDADGFTSENLGLLMAGRKRVAACTPAGVIEILKHYKIDMAEKHAVVVGRSLTVGKPMAQLLLEEHATVSICHSRTRELETHTLSADILVVAAGRPLLVGREHVKQGAVVIDVGIHRVEDASGKKIVGDVRSDELHGWASALTPVPGGVGPMTISLLLENTLVLAELRTQGKR